MTSNLISNARTIGLDPYTSTTLWVFQGKLCRSLSYGTAQSKGDNPDRKQPA